MTFKLSRNLQKKIQIQRPHRFNVDLDMTEYNNNNNIDK